MRRVLVAAVLAAASLAVPAGAASAPPTFGVPRIVDPNHTYGEPDIKLAPNGDVHVSGPQGTGVQRSIWNISKDNGDSWRVVQGVPSSDTQPVCALAPTTCLDIYKSSLG